VYWVASAGYKQVITIRARKYDLAPHVEWQARLVRADAGGVVTLAVPGTTLLHHTRGLRIPQDHYCLSLFPRDAWHNAMLDFDQDGRPLGVYCNVAMPYQWASDCLTWVDLDLDIVMAPDRAIALVDEDEFEVNARRFGYPTQVVTRVRAAAAELLDLAGRAALPFHAWDLADALEHVSSKHGWSGDPTVR
jgi:protein associated with RNAse G/E